MGPDQIQDNLWWVLDSKIAGVRTPEEDEMQALQAADVGAVVSVRDDPANIELYASMGLPHKWIPFKGGTPPTREQLDEFCAFVDEQIEAGNGVAVHCSNGRRRTGTIVAGYLILKQGFSAEDALALVAEKNPEADPRAAQREFLAGL